jgi:hypothetical protein
LDGHNQTATLVTHSTLSGYHCHITGGADIGRDRCDADTTLGYWRMYHLPADLAMKACNSDLRLREQIIYQNPGNPAA